MWKHGKGLQHDLRRLAETLPPGTRALVIELDELGFRTLLRDRARIGLARASGVARPNAIWLAWSPEPLTTVSWTEAYSVYAAAIPERSGAAIFAAASAPALERAVHPFLGDAFAPPVVANDLPPGHYGIRNVSPSARAFGLLQAAAIGGTVITSLLNAVVLPPGFAADFTGFDRLYLWVQGGISGATAIAEIDRPVTTIVYAGGEYVKFYRYDPRTSLFIPSSGLTRAH